MKHKENILKLRAEGKSYNEIVSILGCSKGAVSFHCGKGQKEKSRLRVRKVRNKQHPFVSKIYHFLEKRNHKNVKIIKIHSVKEIFMSKITDFGRSEISRNEKTFNYEDVINKVGENPICYLTGDEIDVTKSRGYNFDHIIPRSRGGQNTLDNLQIATKAANDAKGVMTPDEFINLCKKVLNHNGYEVNKK